MILLLHIEALEKENEALREAYKHALDCASSGGYGFGPCVTCDEFTARLLGARPK